jgi:hypothetical protein
VIVSLRCPSLVYDFIFLIIQLRYCHGLRLLKPSPWCKEAIQPPTSLYILAVSVPFYASFVSTCYCYRINKSHGWWFLIA